MSISFRILGTAGRDNALFVQVDSGQAVERLLFDCGDGCVSELPFADIQAIAHGDRQIASWMSLFAHDDRAW